MKKYYLGSFALIFFCFKNFAQPCSELFISEYIEGSSFNKVIEIYNPTAAAIDLGAYRLQTYFNASDTAQYHMQLFGVLPAGSVYVISNAQADASVLAIADTTNSFVVNWNGNDAVVLLNTATGDTADKIGIIGDVVTNWAVGSGSTQDNTLVRMASVQEGTTDWSLSSTQWDVYPQNDFSHLGSHTMTPCIVLPDPEVFFIQDTFYYAESGGQWHAAVGILNPNGNATSVLSAATDGTATGGSDYSAGSSTITFPPGSSATQLATGQIMDDAIAEADETFSLTLSNPTNNATISNGECTVVIVDNDGLSAGNISPAHQFITYPNPAGNVLNVAMSSVADEIWIENIVGQKMISVGNNSALSQQLNITSLASGIYILKVRRGDEILSKKILKK